ncbi:hypothetical protein DXA89_10500 [Weissella cibaria]|nr:hypothetical protein DXA89_10500 [Weissella cibaria]
MNVEEYSAVITELEAFVGDIQAMDLTSRYMKMTSLPTNQPIYGENKDDIIIKVANTLGLDEDYFRSNAKVSKGIDLFLTISLPVNNSMLKKSYSITVSDSKGNHVNPLK